MKSHTDLTLKKIYRSRFAHAFLSLLFFTISFLLFAGTELQTSATGEAIGISKPTPFSLPIFYIGTTFALLGFIFIFSTIQKNGFLKTPKAWVFIGATYLQFILLLVYAMSSSFQSRTHDLAGHLDYIKILVNLGYPSDLNACWQCHHPPLYYYLSSLVVRIISFIFSMNWTTGLSDLFFPFGEVLQLFSVFLFIPAIICIFLLSKKLEPYFYQICFLLTASLFSGVIFHTASISNDALYYTLSISWFTLLIYKSNVSSFRFWVGLGLLGGLATLTKASGFLLLLLGLTLFLINAFSESVAKEKFQFKKNIYPILFTLFLFILLLFQAAKRTSVFETRSFQLPKVYSVSNSIKNYLDFSPHLLFEQPFQNTGDVNSDRANYFRTIIRTGFFGEWPHPAKLKPLAQMIYFFFFLTVGFWILKVFYLRKKLPTLFSRNTKLHESNFILVYICIAYFASLLYLRYFNPYASSGDFRYILPVYLIATFLYFKLLEEKSTIHAKKARRGLMCMITHFPVFLPVVVSALSTIFVFLLIH